MGHGEGHDEPRDEGRNQGRDGDQDRNHDDDREHGGERRASRRRGVPDPMDRTWVHPTEFATITPGLGPADPPKRSRARRSARWLVPVLAGAAGALVTVGILAATGAIEGSSSDNSAQTATQQSAPGADASRLPEAATNAGLSIVAVSVRDDKGTRRGSAVCIRHGGEMLTSAQLVGTATSVDVVTKDGQRHTARVLGRDTTTDLVLLAVDDASEMPAAQLADRAPDPGSHVWVVGATPGAQNVWTSSGTVSSNDAIVSNAQGPQTAGLLETDATTGGAATGGALVDDTGTVVGIVLGRIGGSDTTYAVAIDHATDVAKQLHDNGIAQHGAAGFTGSDSKYGPMIATVATDGPAAKAGLKKGDVVMSVGGRAVESMGEVLALVRAADPGDKVIFEVQRGRDEVTADVELGTERG
jgi:putative serine protease PepD